MADNQVYQRQNILLADTQPLQFTDLKESIKRSSSLQSSLDKISDFAFKGASEKAKAAGLEYGVANPPSIEQISNAQKAGKNIKDLFSEDYTIFGEAAREAQASALKTDLEAQARNQFSRINAVIDSGQDYNMTDITTELNSVIDGHSKVLAQISPENSLKYRQSVSVLGHAVYKNGLDRMAKRIEAENLSKVDDQLDTFKNNIPVMFDAYKTFDEFNTAISTDENNIKELLANIPADKIPEYYKKIKDIKKNAVMDRIGTYVLNDKTFATSAGEAALKLEKGQAGDYTQFMNAYIPVDERMNIIKRMTEKSSQQFQLIKAHEELNTKLKEDTYRTLQSDYYTGKLGPSEYLTALTAQDIHIDNKEYEEVINGEKDTPSKQRTFSNMLNRVETDSLSLQEIDNAAGNSITFKQAFNLKDRYFKRTDDDKDGTKAILNTFEIPSNEVLILKLDKQAMVAKASADFKRKQAQARIDGTPFNTAEEGKKSALAIMDATYTTDYKSAQVILKTLSQTYGFPYSENAYKATDVDKKYKDIFYKKAKDDTIAKSDLKKMKEALRNIDQFNNLQKANSDIRVH
jgi:hypothetical protein